MPENTSGPRLAPVRDGTYRYRTARAGERSVVDLRSVFDVLPTPILVLTPAFVIVDMNAAYLATAGRGREDLIGRVVFDAFPDNLDEPDANGVKHLRASLERVVATGEPDTMQLQRYDVIDPTSGRYEKRYWSPINVPVLDDDGTVTLIVHRVVEVTGLVHPHEAAHVPDASPEVIRVHNERTQSELVVRADMLRSTLDGLRTARDRDELRSRDLEQALELNAYVASTLQHTMLPRVAVRIRGVDVAARYLPAAVGLQVGGDWYDIIELGAGLVGLVVGDVVGRGLHAAAVMGQLRSATMMATMTTHSPSQALRLLDQFADSVDGASCATAFAVVVDTEHGQVTYASAGHPPGFISRSDGSVHMLDSVRGLPLGIHVGDGTREEASALLAPGDTLVLYTDGLIERRQESIDVGIQRLARCVSTHRQLDSQDLAAHIIAERDDTCPREDDTALVVFRRR